MGVIFFSTIHTRHGIKVSKLQKYVFQHYKLRERKLVFICFEKDDHKLPRKSQVSSHYEEEEAPVSKVEEHYHHFFIKQLK